MDDQRRVAMFETKNIDTAPGATGIGITRWRFQLDNHLGSATLELDQSGNVITYEEYHPYGSTAFHAASGGLDGSAKRYRYTGKERDEETGLYYHGARYYAPWLGRWTAADPLARAMPGKPDLNGYAYTRGNPLIASDPTGLDDEKAAALGHASGKAANRASLLASAPEEAGAAKLRGELEKRYDIKIEKGDRYFTETELKHLEYSLSRLEKEEAAALAGYQFVRWRSQDTRAKLDQNYRRSDVEEAGEHQLDFRKNLARISLYNTTFSDPQTVEGQPRARMTILHEIGHAMSVAQLRKVYSAYLKASDAYNSFIKNVYNKAATDAAQKALAGKEKALLSKVETLEKKMETLEGVNDVNPAEAKLSALIPEEKRDTNYAKTSAKEAFAEEFALYKLSPKNFAKAHPEAAKFFSSRAFLKQ
jgi:RHS repeat-associated protein